jgi:hypothetical protein
MVGVLACALTGCSEDNPVTPELPVYSEDFEVDPQYLSMQPAHVHWFEPEHAYQANVIDVSSGVGPYVGYSPEFEEVSGDCTIQFDVKVLNPDWGSYPGVHFQNTKVQGTTEHDGYLDAFFFRYAWSDFINRRFVLQRGTGGTPYFYMSDESPVPGRWYRMTIVYSSSSRQVDWLVEDLSVDPPTEFYSIRGAEFPLPAGFNRLYIGAFTTPPRYGDESTILVDNILIEA